MAKKKKKKEKKETFDHKEELIGIALILCSILGIGKYGIVGRAIASFSLFLVGSIYMVLLLVFLVVGLYMIVNREKPDLFTTKLIGIYIAVIGF